MKTLLITLLMVSNSVFSFGSEYFCRIKEAREGKCEKNDMLIVLHPIHVVQYCNLDSVVTYMYGSEGDISSSFICSYIGQERKDRGKS